MHTWNFIELNFLLFLTLFSQLLHDEFKQEIKTQRKQKMKPCSNSSLTKSHISKPRAIRDLLLSAWGVASFMGTLITRFVELC